MKIFPAIDIFAKKAVRLYKGDYNQMTVYSDNPLSVAKEFEKANAKNIHVCVLVVQWCLTLCDPTDCSPPGSSVHGILQGRILEWVAIPFSRGSSQPRDLTQVSCTAGRFFTILATRDPP